jgi:hypothetical protein
MAEFSKQWVELNDPEMGWDFDIEAIASEMPNSTMTDYYICEGFGAVAIGKDENGEIQLAIATGNYNDEGHIEVEWKALEEVING